MAISCTYCGGSHATPSQVRECWVRSTSGPLSSIPSSNDSTTPAPVPPQAIVQPANWSRPGPDELARGYVTGPNTHTPTDWRDAQRVVIDAAALLDPGVTIDRLTAAAHAQTRVVIELHVPFHEVPQTACTLAPFQLDAAFTFPLEVLHHLVWANAIDGTTRVPQWALLDAAAMLGAEVVSHGPGDIRLPDGSLRWLDAGPLRRIDPIDGIAVIHAVSIEHGSLRAPQPGRAAAQLALDQRAAVNHGGGSARVIAPAGSGKTRVLTERARHLLGDWNVPPSALSLVAFNKRAQEEMQTRTRDMRGLRVRTLNAIALAIVNGSAPFQPQSRQFRTIDEPDVRRIIGRLVQFPRRRNTDPMASWIEALSVIRLGLREPAEVEQLYNGDVDGLTEMWPQYRRALDRDSVVDFDDQIYRALELLLTDPAARRTAQRACRVLLVDEFQDLTPAHVLLVRLLSAPDFSVFAVGDDDQTIYGYSGADPRWLINFQTMFPHAGLHPLQVNYRCPGDVVQAADRLVRHNQHRVAKTIVSARPQSSGLSVIRGPDTLASCLSVVMAEIDGGRDPVDIAVLTRVNALLAPVQIGLGAAGVPVRGGVGSEFVDRTAVRAALAWLRLAVADPNALDPLDLAEALRRPSRPLHPNVATWVGEQHSLDGLHRLVGRLNAERDQQRVGGFASDIARLQRLAKRATTAQLLSALGDDMGLGASIATLDESRRGMNRAAQNDDLVAMTQLASLQPVIANFETWLRTHLATPWSPAGITLATVHRVKGQEWPLVVLHHAEADQYPHRLAQDHEEERRVFHVALTRCREQVIVVVGDQPSPYVAEMASEPPDRAAVPVDNDLRPVRDRRPVSAAKMSDSVFVKGSVLAAPGMLFVDGGHEWLVESVDAEGVMTRQDKATRRFLFGAAVVTRGRQRGVLTAVVNNRQVAESSIRAYDLLRQIRETLRNGKPAYVVFDDATLERIALSLPGSTAELQRIQGIGPAKLEHYGDSILAVIETAQTAVDASA